MNDTNRIPPDLRAKLGQRPLVEPGFPPTPDSLFFQVIEFDSNPRSVLARCAAPEAVEPVAFLVLPFWGSYDGLRTLVDGHGLYVYDLNNIYDMNGYNSEIAHRLAELWSLVSYETPFSDMPTWITDEYIDENGDLIIDSDSWVSLGHPKEKSPLPQEAPGATKRE